MIRILLIVACATKFVAALQNPLFDQSLLINEKPRCCKKKFNIAHVRIPKTASSTVSGILRQYASNHGMSGSDGQAWICAVPGCEGNRNCYPTAEQETSDDWVCNEPGLYSNHFRGFGAGFNGHTSGTKFRISHSARQLTLPLVLVTFIREPLALQKSHWFWEACAHDRAIGLKKIKEKSYGKAQLEYIREYPSESIDHVMKRFFFIGVVERFDESVVQLFSMLNAPLSDAVYLRAKDTSKCDVEMPKDIEEFYDSPEHIARLGEDYELYSQADDRLTKLVNNKVQVATPCGNSARSTAERKQNAVKILQHLNEHAERKCGKWQERGEDCFGRFGCGRKCRAKHISASNCSEWAEK